MSLQDIPKGRQESEIMSFCNKNGIFIYLQAISNTQGRIDVKTKDRGVRQGKVIFNTSKRIKPKELKWWKEIRKGYEFYYNKLNK